MTCVVISQPMFLPWRGMFEQMQLADHYVHYDDVQLPLGGGKGRGFTTRVQIKTEQGIRWLSVPLARAGKGEQLIRDAVFADDAWRASHLGAIRQAYRAAPHFTAVFEELVRPIYDYGTDRLAEFCIHSFERLARFLGLTARVIRSSAIDVPPMQDASERVLAICRRLGANRYVTGRGALDYLRHEIFDAAGVAVEYMAYALTPYPQLHGTFTPYVSIIDLLFNTGPAARTHLAPATQPWREARAQ
jgi:hypothetical protein